jgi:hypothetical protein
MCQAVPCKTCGKTTWAGCGEHVDQVMAGVPQGDRCAGYDGSNNKGWLARILGR